MPHFTRRKFLVHGAGFGTILMGGDTLSRPFFRVTVGVVGLGVTGRNHLRILSQLSGVHIAAICDPDSRALQAGAQLVANRAALLTDFRRLLDRPDIDLVAISAAPTERMRMIEAAAQARKHVVVQQPGVLSLQEAAQLQKIGTKFPILVEHFPFDPGWDGEALIPHLSVPKPQRVEIQVLRDDDTLDSSFEEFDIAARLLTFGFPQRAVAFTAAGFRGWDLSTEVEAGAARIAVHRSRWALPRGIERRVRITVESPRRTATVVIDSCCEGVDSRQSMAAWSRAVAAVANGSLAGWMEATQRTAVVSATVHMVSSAIRRGESSWRETGS